jgi:hypothetical protein
MSSDHGIANSTDGDPRPNRSVPPPLPTGHVGGRAMYCAACGRSMPESAGACPSCGAAVASGDLGKDPLMRMVMPVGRSGLAIAAGYLGLVSVMIPFAAPVALVVGILALRDLRRHPEKHGMGRAIFGVVMGGLFTILLVAILVISILAGLNGRR